MKATEGTAGMSKGPACEWCSVPAEVEEVEVDHPQLGGRRRAPTGETMQSMRQNLGLGGRSLEGDGVKMVIAIRKDLGMSRGKLVAQGAHAAVGAVLEARKLTLMGDFFWFEDGQKKVVVSVDSEAALLTLEAAALKLDLPHYLVRDRGRTELDPDTATAIAIGPAEEDELDPITGALRLYK